MEIRLTEKYVHTKYNTEMRFLITDVKYDLF